jgi:hypothetical protein
MRYEVHLRPNSHATNSCTCNEAQKLNVICSIAVVQTTCIKNCVVVLTKTKENGIFESCVCALPYDAVGNAVPLRNLHDDIPPV